MLNIKELDVIETKDGKQGTVLLILQEEPNVYLVEIEQDEVTVKEEEIEEVVWTAK